MGDDAAGAGRPVGGLDAHRPFRPRLARIFSLGLAAVVLVATVLLIVLLPGVVPGDIGPDLVGFALFGGAIAWFCWRQASVRADVDATGVTVRNLVLTRRLEWAEIVSVRFGQGRPWVQLDLADGDTLAVMGIQRADGDRAIAEASRLATLVALHTGEATPPDRG